MSTPNPVVALRALVSLTDAVIDRLRDGDEDEAHAALTVLLVTALQSFGHKSIMMTQFFPALEAIKSAIDAPDLERALGHALRFRTQLDEVIGIVQTVTRLSTANAN